MTLLITCNIYFCILFYSSWKYWSWNNNGVCYDLQDLYLRVKYAIESPDVSAERLRSLWRNLEASVLSSKRIQWGLQTTKPCSEEMLAALLDNFATLESMVQALMIGIAVWILFWSANYVTALLWQLQSMASPQRCPVTNKHHTSHRLNGKQY